MIEKFFSPQSIVVIGASNKRGKVGYALAKNLQSFKGKVFFVNKKKETVFGDDVFASVLEIQEKIDLALIAVPASFVKDVLEECGVKGIKSIIIISAGFGESGNIDAQEELLKIAKKFDITLLGPDCFGIVEIRESIIVCCPKMVIVNEQKIIISFFFIYYLKVINKL